MPRLGVVGTNPIGRLALQDGCRRRSCRNEPNHDMFDEPVRQRDPHQRPAATLVSGPRVLLGVCFEGAEQVLSFPGAAKLEAKSSDCATDFLATSDSLDLAGSIHANRRCEDFASSIGVLARKSLHRRPSRRLWRCRC